MTTSESRLEKALVAKLQELKYEYRPDIRDRSALKANFREKFEALNRVQLTDEQIRKIVNTYQQRPQNEERYARRVGMDEIEANDFKLNISRYVSTDESEEEIDLAEAYGKLVWVERQIRESSAKHNELLKELGLSPLP